VPSEFAVDLCFIRAYGENPVSMRTEIEAELTRIFALSGTWFMEVSRSKEEAGRELEIAVVQVQGLSHWKTEQEVLDDLEGRMESECWSWLNGYRMAVIPKEDAGPCAMKPRP